MVMKLRNEFVCVHVIVYLCVCFCCCFWYNARWEYEIAKERRMMYVKELNTLGYMGNMVDFGFESLSFRDLWFVAIFFGSRFSVVYSVFMGVSAINSVPADSVANVAWWRANCGNSDNSIFFWNKTATKSIGSASRYIYIYNLNVSRAK